MKNVTGSLFYVKLYASYTVVISIATLFVQGTLGALTAPAVMGIIGASSITATIITMFQLVTDRRT